MGGGPGVGGDPGSVGAAGLARHAKDGSFSMSPPNDRATVRPNVASTTTTASTCIGLIERVIAHAYRHRIRFCESETQARPEHGTVSPLRGRLPMLFLTLAFAAAPPPIINGDITHEYPEVVMLYASDSDGYGGGCTGSVIAEDWILTAAHCVHSDASFDVDYVYVGFVNQSNDMDETNTVLARRWFEHEDYNPSDGSNDIALIELRDATDVPVMRLAEVALQRSDEGEDFRIVGFGVTSDTDSASNMKKRVVDVPLEGYTASLMHTEDRPDHQNACHGDSGGPVMRLYEDGTYSVAGIVNFGGPSCERDGAYSARVDAYMDFIDEHTNDYTLWEEAEEVVEDTDTEDTDADALADDDDDGAVDASEAAGVCATGGGGASALGVLAAGAAAFLRSRKPR